jgi:hypothetical protein
MTTTQKRQAGDRWGIVCINSSTGKEQKVQIGYHETSTFIWPKQAQEYADFYNQEAQRKQKPERYEVRYAGNYRLGIAGLI